MVCFDCSGYPIVASDDSGRTSEPPSVPRWRISSPLISPHSHRNVATIASASTESLHSGCAPIWPPRFVTDASAAVVLRTPITDEAGAAAPPATRSMRRQSCAPAPPDSS